MIDRVLKAVDIFLTQLESVQTELSTLMAQKRTALTEVQGQELARISTEEQQLLAQLQKLLRERGKILDFARQKQLPSESLLQLVKGIAEDSSGELIARLEQAQETAAKLRFESWVHWIISHRSFNHYTELIELIAHCGQQSPTYTDGKKQSHSGGALLDASI